MCQGNQGSIAKLQHIDVRGVPCISEKIIEYPRRTLFKRSYSIRPWQTGIIEATLE